jgi:hypothetical protein
MAPAAQRGRGRRHQCLTTLLSVGGAHPTVSQQRQQIASGWRTLLHRGTVVLPHHRQGSHFKGGTVNFVKSGKLA